MPVPHNCVEQVTLGANRLILQQINADEVFGTHRMPPNMFQLPKVLTEAEVIEAEAELKALQRHALEVVDPEAET